jgi:UPF0755 protein
VVLFVGVALVWLGTRKSGTGRAVEILWPRDPGEGASLLAGAGVIDRPAAFRLLLAVTGPLVSPVEGAHLLTDDLTPAEVLRRLARLSSRERARVLVPEGWNRFQIGDRLEALRVCSKRGFGERATSRDGLRRLAVGGDSVEGYLFPATYDLFLDSDPDALLAQMVAETKRRLGALETAHAEDFRRLEAKYGWGEREILTLASVVEKESGQSDEQPVIASVFYNRLDSPEFRPARALQSDPTAAYGCLAMPALESCRGYSGRVTPAMIRDPENPYNTYRHPGLPPGPIANPGVRAIEAVLQPATTEYLFFVASGGKHVFSRSLEEHEAAIRGARDGAIQGAR